MRYPIRHHHAATFASVTPSKGHWYTDINEWKSCALHAVSSVRKKWATFLSFTTLEHRLKRSVWDKKRLVRNRERGRVDPGICRETQLCTVLCLIEQGKAVTRRDVKSSLKNYVPENFDFGRWLLPKLQLYFYKLLLYFFSAQNYCF